jgi:hypothetical protein
VKRNSSEFNLTRACDYCDVFHVLSRPLTVAIAVPIYLDTGARIMVCQYDPDISARINEARD